VSRAKKIKQTPRLAALEVVGQVLDSGKSLAECEPVFELSDERDTAFARRLAYGVLRWLSALEWLAAELLSKPLKKRDSDIQRLILLGLHQLWHGEIASHAAINETAQCARLLGKDWAVGLINAVLRRFQREREPLLEKLGHHDQCYAHPGWLLDEIRRDWPGHWQAIIEANNSQAPLWLRINRQRFDDTVMGRELQAAGFEVSGHPFAADAICITPPAGVAKIPGFKRGSLSVQDPAAQLAKDLVDPRPGERILDACAAPGGKTAHLLEACPGIELTALDRQARRVDQIHETLGRLGLSASVLCADATATGDWWSGEPYDKILLDAPCSATGVIRRHPEIKWLRSEDQVDNVVGIQAALLSALWPTLKGGGILVYATCSLLKRENSGQIEQFLAQHDDAHLQVLEVDWGVPGPFGRQVMPGGSQMDGFFYALLRKTG
jgi:16S rRNA (cytosine967-C5)-methyltransferase